MWISPNARHHPPSQDTKSRSRLADFVESNLVSRSSQCQTGWLCKRVDLSLIITSWIIYHSSSLHFTSINMRVLKIFMYCILTMHVYIELRIDCEICNNISMYNDVHMQKDIILHINWICGHKKNIGVIQTQWMLIVFPIETHSWGLCDFWMHTH